MVRRVIEDEIAGLSHDRRQAALISVVSMVEEGRKNTKQKPFSPAAKVKSLAVWWTNSEASNANYERQTISKHDNLNQRRCSHKSIERMGVAQSGTRIHAIMTQATADFHPR